MEIKGNIQSNVRLIVVDRATGRVKETRYARDHNTVTNIDKLLDLMDGSATDHINSTGRIVIKDSGGSTIKTISTMEATYPTTPSGGSVTFKWGDITSDTYNPDDIELHTSTGVKVAETLNVVWADKLASENWFFEWDLSLGSADGNFDNAGFNGMLECITGESANHWDGTEGDSRVGIQVFDGTPGVLEKSVTVSEATVRTTTSLKWIMASTFGAATWSRVELQNIFQGVVLYDDDFATREQLSGDIFTYEFTVTFADS